MRLIYFPSQKEAKTVSILFGPENSLHQIKNAFDELSVVFAKKKNKPTCFIGTERISPEEILIYLRVYKDLALIGASVRPFVIECDMTKPAQKRFLEHLGVDHLIREIMKREKPRH